MLPGHSQLLKKLGAKVKSKVEQRADQKTDQAIDKGLDKTEKEIKDTTGKNKPGQTPANTATPLKVYQNYDFVPGDKILFEDHFTDDQDGEFATHWELKEGQAILNKAGGELAMHLT